MTDITEILLPYDPVIDSDKRLHLSCVCDGTLAFALQMRQILEAIRCTDIVLDGKDADKEEIPEGKPWCSYKFIASGLLPKDGWALEKTEGFGVTYDP